MKIPNPQSAKPITAPALNAVLKHAVHPGFCAEIVVLTLEKTATFIPKYPEAMEVSAPRTKEVAVRTPRAKSQPVPQATSVKTMPAKKKTKTAQ
mmetsp:Transcript_22423/g.27480  ORF Transcript_22423/g.27480 Transcript_22423/m.27480 type:complete len:94 (+) Transcript_22423:238-519(+)